jgi:hypothetical protein
MILHSAPSLSPSFKTSTYFYDWSQRILIVYYSYETSLPELVGSIVAKFEPENKHQSILESPVFKKKRVANRKPSSAKRAKPLKDKPCEEKKSKSNSIWERLSKRALPLRKGSKKALPSTNNAFEKIPSQKHHSLTVYILHINTLYRIMLI